MKTRNLATLVVVGLYSFGNSQGAPSVRWAMPGIENNGWAAFTPDGDYILDASEQNNVRLRDASTGIPLWVINVPYPSPRTIDVSPDGSLFALGRTNLNAGRPSVYRMEDQSLVWEKPSIFDCFGVMFTGAGDRLFTTGSGGGVIGYDTVSGAMTNNWSSGGCFGLARSKDGKLMAYSTLAKHVFVRDLSTNAILWDFSTGANARVLRITPDSKHLAAWVDQNIIQIWSLETGTMERQWQANTGSFAPYGQVIMDMSPDGRYIVSTYHNDPRLPIYRVSDGALVRYYDSGFGNQPDSPCFSRDGRTIFFVGSDGLVRLIDAPVQPEEVLPDTARTVLGRLDSGSVASLFDVEGNAYRVCKFFVPNQLVAPVIVEVTGVSPLVPSTLNFRVDSRMTAGGSFSIALKLFNYRDGAFETFPATGITTTSDIFMAVPTGDDSRFVGSAKELKARYEVRTNGFVATQAWCNETELARWWVQ